jgi:glutamate-1-semialdehyde 2,1-aminomutase
MSGYSFDVSRSMLARLCEVDAMASARPGGFFTGYERIGGYPVFAERASGPYLWDVDGNRYVDYLLGYGSVILGHADPAVTAEVTGALERGVNPTLVCPSQMVLAEEIVSLYPCAELVTFLKTGSDAVSAAVRLARAVTGRTHVLQWGQHGWHDWAARSSPGVLADTKARSHPFAYNDLADAERLFGQFAGDVAALVMMPYELDAPEPGYLESLRELTHRHGALFVFDEIRSGFRIAMGGAQEHFGVVPDLATLSKGLSNGHAISVLAGRGRYMQRILDLELTITYYRSADAFAAANATIAQLKAGDGPARLASLGARLMAGLDDAAAAAGVPARAVGFPATPFVEFGHTRPAERDRAMRRFSNGMLARGVLMTPAHHWFVCTSMEEADIDFTVQTAAEVFDAMAHASG